MNTVVKLSSAKCGQRVPVYCSFTYSFCALAKCNLPTKHLLDQPVSILAIVHIYHFLIYICLQVKEHDGTQNNQSRHKYWSLDGEDTIILNKISSDGQLIGRCESTLFRLVENVSEAELMGNDPHRLDKKQSGIQ